MEITSATKEEVRERYASAARAVIGAKASCCKPGLRCCDPITTGLYSADQAGAVPE